MTDTVKLYGEVAIKHDAIEMNVFDHLPAKIRTAMCYSAARHDAVEIRTMLADGWDEDMVLRTIINTDAAMAQGHYFNGR